MGSQFHPGHVSSSRLVKQGMRICRTLLSCPLHPKGYEFALRYISSAAGLADFGCFYHFTPASQVGGGSTDSRVPLLHGHYSASLLLRTPPSPSPLRPTSRSTPVIRPTLLRRVRDGRRRASPVAWRVLVTVLPLSPRRSGVSCQPAYDSPYCLHPTVAGSALGATHFRGHIHVHCRYGPVTRGLPKGDPVDRLQDFGFPPPCYPNYRAPDFCPGRLVSC